MTKRITITKKDLDKMAETHPKLVEHYRHIKKDISNRKAKGLSMDEDFWLIYYSTRWEIIDLLFTLKIRKEVKKT